MSITLSRSPEPKASRSAFHTFIGIGVAVAVVFGGVLVATSPASAAKPDGSNAELLINSRDRAQAIQPGVVNPWIGGRSGGTKYRLIDADGVTGETWKLPHANDGIAFALTVAGDEEPVVPTEASTPAAVYGDVAYSEGAVYESNFGTWAGISGIPTTGLPNLFSGFGRWVLEPGVGDLGLQDVYAAGELKKDTVYSLVAFAIQPQVAPDYTTYVDRDASGHAVSSWLNFTVSDEGFTLVSRVLPKVALTQSVTGTTATVTATLQDSGTGVALPDASGTVSFFKGDDVTAGTAVGTPVAVDSTGKASIELKDLVPGSTDGYYAIYTADATAALKYTDSEPAQTTVIVPKAELAASAVAVTVSKLSYGTAGTATVKVTSTGTVGGAVTVTVGGVAAGSFPLVNGTATVPLSSSLTAGKKAIVASYAGTDSTQAATATVSATVAKATSTASVKLSKSKAVVKKTKVKATVTIKIPGTKVVPAGKVAIKVGSKTVKTVTLKASYKGKFSVTLPKFSKTGKITVKVVYAGSSNIVKKTSKAVSIKVVKK